VAEQEFPAYFKYADGKSFFKVLSESTMEELKIIGQRYSIYFLEAKILPERLLISDMLSNNGEHWQPSNAAEYAAQMQLCESSLQRLN